MKIACQDGRVVRVPKATLAGADLRGLNLHRAVLERHPMSGIVADGVDFRGALLSLANADGASLSGAILVNARCERMSLRGARLGGAILSSAHLNGADLTDADLRGARVPDADFSGANLDGADLRFGDGEGARWTGAVITPRTILHEGFEPFKVGMVLVGDQTAIFYEDGEPASRLFPRASDGDGSA